MFEKAAMLFLYTETPLHAGSGTSIAAVDLPIQRERHTNYPMVQASGVKGTLRDALREKCKISFDHLRELAELRQILEDDLKKDQQKQQKKQELEKLILPWEMAFGPDHTRAQEHASALSFTDASLLLFPVRSLHGVFAWITCPLVLDRFARRLKYLPVSKSSARSDTDWSPQEPWDNLQTAAAVAEGSRVRHNGAVVLEDFAFNVAKDSQSQRVSRLEKRVSRLGKWLAKYALPSEGFHYHGSLLPESLVVLPDEAFRDFVTHSTEVIARIRIDQEVGTVQEGALWDQENLPSDCLLYTMPLAVNPRLEQSLQNQSSPGNTLKNADHVLGLLANRLPKMIQLGGNETLGNGFVHTRLLSEVDRVQPNHAKQAERQRHNHP